MITNYSIREGHTNQAILKCFNSKNQCSKGGANHYLASAKDRNKSEISLRTAGRNQNSALAMYFNITATEKNDTKPNALHTTMKKLGARNNSTKNFAQTEEGPAQKEHNKMHKLPP